MTDFKLAEQQVRETLGWWIEVEPGLPGSCLQYEWVCAPDGSRSLASERELAAYNALVSKTAELLEMTAQRDEAQKALEIAKDENDFWQREMMNYRINATHRARQIADQLAGHDTVRAESSEATIREQAERIKELEKERFLYCPKCTTQIRITL